MALATSLALCAIPTALSAGPSTNPLWTSCCCAAPSSTISDLITPAQQSNSVFWSRQGKTPVFLIDDFLAQIPPIPPESLSAICCWGLLDLLPREALPRLVERFHSYLQPGGVLFSILREPHVTTGAETRWWFESLTVLGSSDTSQKPFPYPALTNREMERLFPGGNVKTFLTRSGRREVLGVK